MKAFLVILFSGCLILSLTACTSNSGKSPQTSITGVLIDQACGSGMMKENNPESAAAGHSRDCAMKPACEASGYAVITGSDMIKFDQNGNTLAKAFLAKTQKLDNLRVTVVGVRTGDTIAVTSLTPAS